MDLSNNTTESTTTSRSSDFVKVLIALAFICCAGYYASSNGVEVSNLSILAIAAAIGAYMAINIGANDVANNVGPAVGAKALSMTGAILIAAIFEASGALIAGGSVVGTIKKGIINPAAIADATTFIWVMMAALLAGAIWLNLATYLGAPVSTTHSIVGGVMGAGIAAGGWDIANWSKVSAIVASWVISPVLGGLIAAVFLFYVKRAVTYKNDMIGAAKKVVPLLIAIMVWAFSTYLIVKGLKKLFKVDFVSALSIGLLIAIAVYLIVRPMIAKVASTLKNEKDSVNSLFTLPLIASAALLSFAHGANDVANAIGPLAAINDALISGGISSKASIPLWIMLVGGIGIAVGLALFGPKLIKTVGSEITHLDKTRAFCVAMAAAITVIIASQLGLPVSSTHIAVGGIFGVGFLREYLKAAYERKLNEVMEHSKRAGHDLEQTSLFVERFKNADVDEKRAILSELKSEKNMAPISKQDRKKLKRATKKELVKRSALLRIAAAWVITVPASALLSALIFYTLVGFDLVNS
ncbi:inorganic phosphate transporter [Marinomonas mediterranea]|jgi:Phosphate/sulphate permeases|uniref:Phosphate transporter n=1 Tax=Marinomonas mediterranea (strain ATCC 700492 / JCM 21426 / NBRC 103028 / MMB-1) TaxID=717774 RepID=F2JWC5_MARM1|nr:inorganic phosphate transporter [Marinomonas mediterranea]ADZ90598.1 phosphate transporter [Marinomonas mediterranea MMB-1]WCN08641.1 inorganic phosphate transporter [Marinomonas mediterranea]WCN16769.1 inorganic phosphate transporter [Marinomonas mediterranea MMB-1]